MSDASISDSKTVEAARRLAPQLWAFVWLGLALLIPGLLIPNTAVSLAFFVSSTSVFGVALLVMALNRKYLASPRHFHSSLDVFVRNDQTATFCITDDGEITYANRAARARFGNVEKKSLVLVLADYSANPVNIIFQLKSQARQGGVAHRDIVTETGHLRLSAHYLGPQGFVWRLEDLVEQRDSGNSVTEPIGLPMLLANPDGAVLHINQALFAKIGCRISHIDRLFHDLPLRPQGLHQIMTKDGPETVRVVEIMRDNEVREVFLIACDPDEIAGASTGRLFDELPVALVKLTQTGMILNANRLARRLLGLKEAREARLGDLVQGLGRPFHDWLAEAADGRVLNRPEVVEAKGQERETYLQITLSRIVEDGETTLIAVLSDATELKTLEAQFVQSQKMQAIGQLAGGVAHDFNNLLTAISGYCDLLLLRHDEGDPDYGDLMQITQNANRAAALVNQLLAFSRKQNLQPETLDLRDTLADLSHLLNRLLGEKVTLSLKSSEALSPVRADKRQLEQVLMNLVVNARDAMAEGGVVTIETENLHLANGLKRNRAIVEPGEYVSIRVSDDGAGISPDRLEKIFEPFYTTKKTGEGTGLGLSMAYGIIKQTGGFIFVDSARGQGTSFQILLPAHEHLPAIEELRPVRLASAQTARDDGVVLLVEDEAPVRAFAARALRMRGYTVLEAADAEEALAMLEDDALSVDVFVTDVIMPGKDGPTWVREALKKRPDVKVVFVSGYAEESFAADQASFINSVFLPKPFSLVDLTDRVRDQMPSQSADPPAEPLAKARINAP